MYPALSEVTRELWRNGTTPDGPIAVKISDVRAFTKAPIRGMRISWPVPNVEALSVAPADVGGSSPHRFDEPGLKKIFVDLRARYQGQEWYDEGIPLRASPMATGVQELVGFELFVRDSFPFEDHLGRVPLTW